MNILQAKGLPKTNGYISWHIVHCQGSVGINAAADHALTTLDETKAPEAGRYATHELSTASLRRGPLRLLEHVMQMSSTDVSQWAASAQKKMLHHAFQQGASLD